MLDHLTVEVDGRRLLDDVSLRIATGKLTVILGGSGAGKSVLLRIIAGLVPPESGTLRYTGGVFLGIESSGIASDERKSSPDHRIGVVFQNFALFDEWSAEDNVKFAIDHRHDLGQPRGRSAREWLDELRVEAHSRPSTMSGGQRQRLAIARTLAAEPSVVLYDEPTSGLDHATGHEVAQLILQTHSLHRQTSVVVTHDYDTMLEIADDCLLLDSATQSLHPVPRDEWGQIASRLKPVDLAVTSTDEQRTYGGRSPRRSSSPIGMRMLSWLDRSILAVGGGVIAFWGLLALPLDIARSVFSSRWALRFFLHAMRLIAGPSSWCYLAIAGAIIGFTSTYFTFRFLPFELYSKPLLIEDLLGSIGFALYRIFVPILATILIAARCGAAIAADVGVKRYGSQIDALQTLGVRPAAYLLAPTVLAFVIATPLLQWIAFKVAETVSLFCFVIMHPDVGPYFWQQHFYRNLDSDGGYWFVGTQWVVLKSLLCGVGIATIAYHQGFRPKGSASDVSESITATVLWSTLFVLVVHFTVALIEF